MNLNELNQNEYNMVINEDKFWSFIDNLNFYNTYKELKQNAMSYISDYLLHRTNINNLSEYQRFEVDKRCEMEEIIRNFLETQENNIVLTYDEIFNLASCIVGLGRTMYYFIKDNPKLIYDLQEFNSICFEDGFDKAIYTSNLVEN